MQETLQQDGEYRLTLEKCHSDWWMELRHLPTGNTRILYAKSKAKALAFFAGMTMEEIKQTYDKINPPTHKMYKAETPSD